MVGMQWMRRSASCAALALALTGPAAEATDQTLIAYTTLPDSLRLTDQPDVVVIRAMIEEAQKRNYRWFVLSEKTKSGWQGPTVKLKELKKLGCERRRLPIAINHARILSGGIIDNDSRRLNYMELDNCHVRGPVVSIGYYNGTVASVDVMAIDFAVPGITNFNPFNQALPETKARMNVNIWGRADLPSGRRDRGGRQEITIYGAGPSVNLIGYTGTMDENAAWFGGNKAIGPSGGVLTIPTDRSQSVYQEPSRRLRSSGLASASLRGQFDMGCNGKWYEGTMRCRFRINGWQPIREIRAMANGQTSEGVFFAREAWTPRKYPAKADYWPTMSALQSCTPPFAVPSEFKVAGCGPSQPWFLVRFSEKGAFPGVANQSFLTGDGKTGELRQLKRLPNGDFELTLWTSDEWVGGRYFIPKEKGRMRRELIRDGSVVSSFLWDGPLLYLKPNGMGQCGESSGPMAPCEFADGQKVESFN